MNQTTAAGKSTTVRERQDPLIAVYHKEPGRAQITDRARTFGGTETDPFHGNVVLGNDDTGLVLPFGIHRAVGGYSDAPNPGDILCGALASCIDSTIRIIAERFGVPLNKLEVEVLGKIDVRGTLLVSREVPVGFEKLDIRLDIVPEDGTNPKIVNKLIGAAERSCVTLQTLLMGAEVETRTR